MDPSMVVAMIAGTVAILSGLLTYRASSQATNVDRRRVDAEAYERAKVIYEGGFALSEQQIKALRDHVERLEAQIKREREVSDELRRQIQGLRDTVARMENHMSLMKTHMQAAGVPMPEGLAG